MGPEEPIPRIALVAHRLGTGVATGIGRYYRELALGIARVTDPAEVQYALATPSEAHAPDWVRPPLEYVNVPGPRRILQMSWTLLERPRLDRALAHPDLVHCLHAWAPTPTSAPLVVTIHDLMAMLQPAFYPAHHRFGQQRGLRYARDHAVRIAVDSQWTAGLVHEHLGVDEARIVVTPLGVSDRFRTPIAPDAVTETCDRYGVEPGRYLLAIGQVSERKNLGVVVDALRRIDPRSLGQVMLLVAGPDGLGSEHLRAHIDGAGLSDRVRTVGYVPDDDLPPLLRGSLCLVHPSKDEGFGFTPIEAMAAHTPAIVSNSGSLPEVAGAAAVLLPPDDPDAWAGAIRSVLSDPERRAALVSAGLEHQATFTWDRAAAATYRLHLDVLAQ